MTEPHLPRDELVSRYVDGDLPTELRALVDDDPRLVEEAARLRSLREALRRVDPLDPTRADAVLVAALAAYDAACAAQVESTPASERPVVRLPLPRWRRSVAWAGAIAAAALAVIGGAALLGRDDRSPSADQQVPVADQAVESELAPAGAAETFAAKTAATDPADSDERPIEEPFPLPPAGSPVILDGPAALEWFARWAEPVPVDQLEATDVACLEVSPGPLLTATAVYDGVPAVVFADESTGEVTAYDAATCAVLAQVAP